MRTGCRGRRAAGRIPAARPARAGAAAALLAMLLAGCAPGPLAVGANVTVPVSTSIPVPQPSTRPVPASGTPSPVATVPRKCLESAPAMSPMPSPGAMPTGSTMREIEKRGYLIVGVDQDSYDWGYPNPTPNPSLGESYVGFDIDMVHALAYAIFGNPDAIRFVPVAQDFRMGAANLGIVDVVADSITITCHRKDQVQFSIDYFDAEQELLVPRDITTISVNSTSRGVPHMNGLDGGKVCTVGTTTIRGEPYRPGARRQVQRGPRGQLVRLPGLLQQGQVQAVSTDSTILGGVAAEDPNLKLAGHRSPTSRTVSPSRLVILILRTTASS